MFRKIFLGLIILSLFLPLVPQKKVPNTNSFRPGEWNHRYTPAGYPCFYFSGSDSISFGNLSTAVTADGIFSLSFWIKAGELTGTLHRTPWSFSADANNQVSQRYPQSGQTRTGYFAYIDATGNTPAIYDPILAGWYHLVFTFNGTTWTVYNNTVQVYTNSSRSDIANLVGTPDFYIGILDGSNYPFLGYIADYRVYNKVLSSGERTSLFELGDVTDSQILRAKQPTEGSTTVLDSSGNGNTGTATSTGIYSATGFPYKLP